MEYKHFCLFGTILNNAQGILFNLHTRVTSAILRDCPSKVSGNGTSLTAFKARALSTVQFSSPKYDFLCVFDTRR